MTDIAQKAEISAVSIFNVTEGTSCIYMRFSRNQHGKHLVGSSGNWDYDFGG